MYDYLTAMMGAWVLPRKDIGQSAAPFASRTSREAQASPRRQVMLPGAQIALIANLSAAR
ncbi:hypothetical protein [Neomegalonema sp.]|uniref:hypothetical protein n=1 Tax=Neomegalonema sp. TaxID=2039713 RepID=UPI00260E5331|nr:hypothetical protein [Neomegalonema sp.]MDD2869825.1 hypothetical protein [Neomegalonema sp.]